MPGVEDNVAGEAGSSEWTAFGGRLRRRTIEALDLITILLQDAVILVAGFAAEFAYDRWLHSTHPFFQLAISLSSALFLLLYGITVTVHIVHYVRGQVDTVSSGRWTRYLPWGLATVAVLAAGLAMSGRLVTEPAGQASHDLRKFD